MRSEKVSTWYMDVVTHVFGLYIVECDYTHWRIQESVFGGSFLAKGPKPGYSQN